MKHAGDVVVLGGVLTVSFGLQLLWPPLMFIFVGLCVMGVGVLMVSQKRKP